MSPRAYDRTLKAAAADLVRRRIAEAAAALHARHGALGTSHAMIAKAAGVSLPTVYKYFPDRDALIPACTGVVAGRAPVALDERLFEGKPRVPDRIHALARAVFRLHEYYAPWLRWVEGDAAALPALRDHLERVRRGRRDLARLALSAPGRRGPSEGLLRLAHVLLDFPSWTSLTASGLTSDRAAALVAGALVSLHGKDRP